jgi:hypothetical protein
MHNIMQSLKNKALLGEKAENTAVGICHAGHVAPSIRNSWH